MYIPFMSCAKARAAEGKRDSGEHSMRCDWNMFPLKCYNQSSNVFPFFPLRLGKHILVPATRLSGSAFQVAIQPLSTFNSIVSQE